MVSIHRSTTGQQPHPVPLHSLAAGGGTQRDAAVRASAWDTEIWRRFYRQTRGLPGIRSRKTSAGLKTYSHSIINEPSKLLIRNGRAGVPQILTVTFTVNLSGTSIGAGFRAIRPKSTFRYLSGSIDSRDDCQRHWHASVSVAEVSKKRQHQTPYKLLS
jgi:hypothetical protein